MTAAAFDTQPGAEEAPVASRKKPAKKNTNRAGKERSTGSYAHPETSALLRPEAGTQAQLRKKKMPVSARRRLFDLSDDMATRINVLFYSDTVDALLE